METSTNSRSVSTPFWDSVCIVAGGPSAQDVPISFLRRQRRLLLVNDAALHLSSLGPAVAVFSLDNHWVRRNRDFLATFQGEKFVALPLETWPDCGGIPGVTYLDWDYDQGLNDDPTKINTGCNSGYGALGIAWHKRAREIFLVGYDMDPTTDVKYFDWIPRFRAAAKQFRAMEVPVWNLNPASHVDAFLKAKITDFRPSDGLGGYKPPPGGLRRALEPLNSQETASYGSGRTALVAKGVI
jgi:hypothetical protein